MQNVPVEQGGDARTNGSAAREFDNVPAGETQQSQQAKTSPGSSELHYILVGSI